MTAAITLGGVTKRFGTVTAVDDLNLEFRQDVITGLLGRNGAGKTVTLSLVTAQERPTTGTIRVFGRNPRENAAVLAQTCFIRDTQRYPDEYRLEHILRLGPVLYGSWDIGLAHRIAGEFGIPRKRTLKKLSRGQLSAVAVLIATASRAPITIFDEPYLGMDATAQIPDAALPHTTSCSPTTPNIPEPSSSPRTSSTRWRTCSRTSFSYTQAGYGPPETSMTSAPGP